MPLNDSNVFHTAEQINNESEITDGYKKDTNDKNNNTETKSVFMNSFRTSSSNNADAARGPSDNTGSTTNTPQPMEGSHNCHNSRASELAKQQRAMLSGFSSDSKVKTQSDTSNMKTTNNSTKDATDDKESSILKLNKVINTSNDSLSDDALDEAFAQLYTGAQDNPIRVNKQASSRSRDSENILDDDSIVFGKVNNEVHAFDPSKDNVEKITNKKDLNASSEIPDTSDIPIDKAQTASYKTDTTDASGTLNNRIFKDVFGSDTEKQKQLQMYLHYTPTKRELLTDMAKYALLEHRFLKKGRYVLAVDDNLKPLMYFYQLNNELMAYKYVGTDLNVEIPAYVGNLPVRYVFRNMFTKMFDLVDRNGFRAIKEQLSGTDIINVNRQSIKDAAAGIKCVVFPNTLYELPDKLFYNCYQITDVVLPASLKNISKSCFRNSGIKNIYFNGTPPESMHKCLVSRNVWVHVHESE